MSFGYDIKTIFDLGKIRDDFIITKKNGNVYRKNRNETGNCIYHQDISCVCCNPYCVYNCSVDDELTEEIEKI